MAVNRERWFARRRPEASASKAAGGQREWQRRAAAHRQPQGERVAHRVQGRSAGAERDASELPSHRVVRRRQRKLRDHHHVGIRLPEDVTREARVAPAVGQLPVLQPDAGRWRQPVAVVHDRQREPTGVDRRAGVDEGDRWGGGRQVRHRRLSSGRLGPRAQPRSPVLEQAVPQRSASPIRASTRSHRACRTC
jgi:hypothetical protein